jgi:dihydroorotate dehydrogenase (NAD+) catalytic subunit
LSGGVNLSVDLGRGLVLPNPVMVASGTFGYGLEYAPFVEIGRLGAVIVKTLTLEPRPGNPGPRIVETPAGMLNAIGLANIGIDDFLKQRLPRLRKSGTPVIVNVYGESPEEFVELVRRVSAADGVAAIEVNLSCPNIEHGHTSRKGALVAQDPEAVARIVTATRAATEMPVIAKLSPNVTDIRPIAQAAEDAGADAVSLVNTITGMAINIETRQPCLANVTGGLSGPAIRPVAVRMVWEAVNTVSIPVIGLGGISCARDAIEFLIAGARAVCVGSATFKNPWTALEVIDGIREYAEKHDIEDINHLVGSIST